MAGGTEIVTRGESAVGLASAEVVLAGERRLLARTLAVEGGTLRTDLLDELRVAARRRRMPVLGVTGTGGSGKSSPADVPVRSRLGFEDEPCIAVLADVPTRRRAGGALPALRTPSERPAAAISPEDEPTGATPSPATPEVEALLQRPLPPGRRPA